MSINSSNYNGPERRGRERRMGVERRAMIRFEPDNPNRRSYKDRRKSIQMWKGRDF